jgi:transcriptional regulator with XRE-family HTH domain
MHIESMPVAIKQRPTTWTHAKKNGAALFAWRRSIGLSRPTFARLANFSQRTLATYEKQEQLPSAIRSQVNEAGRLVIALREIIPANELSAWLQKPIRVLEAVGLGR